MSAALSLPDDWSEPGDHHTDPDCPRNSDDPAGTPCTCEAPQSQGGEPTPSKCRRSGCTAPGILATVLVKHGDRWVVRHCEAHRRDGADFAVAMGFPVLTPTLHGQLARPA